jgi:hypothetical protein
MSYKGANPERVALLIEHALSPSELRAFVRSKNKLLILAQEKPRHQPTQHSKAALWIARFGERGQSVFAGWIHEELTAESEIPVAQLVPRFKAIEREGVEFDDVQMTSLCQLGLRNLYSESPDEYWLQYLATEPLPQPESTTYPTDDESSEAPEAPSLGSAEAMEALVRWTRGESSIESIANPMLQLSAKLIGAARSADPRIIEELPGPADQYAGLEALLRQRPIQQPEAKGLQATAPTLIEYDPTKEYSALEIIATLPRRAAGQAYFLSVEAFIDRDTVQTLNYQGLAKAFPDNAEIILFRDLEIDPVVGRPAAYRVERAVTSGKVKFRVIAEGRPLTRVFYVPAASKHPDQVREWMSDFARAVPESTAVFVLNDGLCIKLRTGTLSRLLQPDFDWTFDGWPSITAVEFHKAPYIVTGLPNPKLQYECAPLAISARRLLRRLSERKSINLTKQQWLAVIDQVRADNDGVDDALRERVVGKLDALSHTEAEYDSIVGELMSVPSVRADIESRKQLEVANTSEELRKERKALDNLRKEKRALEESIEYLKDQHDARAKNLRAAMRRVFEEAKEKEADTLAQAALLDVLTPQVLPNREVPRDDSAASATAVVVQSLEVSTVPLADEFRGVGFPDAVASLYARALQLGFHAGLPVIIEGPGAAYFSVSVARSLERGLTTTCDIPLGLITIGALRAPLERHSEGPLVLKNANLSDVSVFGADLIEGVMAYQLGRERLRIPRPWILAGAGGPASLPWPADLQCAALKLNLAASPYSSDGEGGAEAVPVSPVQRKIWSRLRMEIEKTSNGEELEGLLAALLMGSAKSPRIE